MRFQKKLTSLVLTMLFAFSILMPSVSKADTLPEASPLQWQTIIFGQSTDILLNLSGLTQDQLLNDPQYARFDAKLASDGTFTYNNNYAKPSNSGTINGTIEMESRGGKIANAHDGIVFYYTKLSTKDNFVLTADVTVKQFGPLPATAKINNQEGAGLMVRDVLGDPRKDPPDPSFEEIPAASNMVAASVFGGSADKQNVNVSMLARNGVNRPWGNASSVFSNQQLTKSIPLNTTFKLKLERTDNSFIATYTSADGQTTVSKTYDGADIVQTLDHDNMYVGFFAARNAWVQFSNTSLTLSPANTQPSAPFVPAKPGTVFRLASASTSATDNYTFAATTNYAGKITLQQDGTTVVDNANMGNDKTFTFNTVLKNQSTTFAYTFTPGSDAPSSTPITKTFTVTKNTSIKNPLEIYASPAGTATGNGTIDNPLDLTTAIKYIEPGGIIYMREGTYSAPTISKDLSGLPDKTKTLKPYNNENVTISGGQVFKLDADYWHIYGLEVTGSTSNGMRLSGNYNIVEKSVFHNNGDAGFQMTQSGGNLDPNTWPQYNLILNCESYDNVDGPMKNADGFAAKLGVGVGNVLKGDISHNNIDDGYDLYNKIENGPNMPITLIDDIAYENGITTDGRKSSSNQGNGFKLGGEGQPVAHVVKNCIAYANNEDGFTDNFNPGKLVLTNNISFDNNRYNYIFRTNKYVDPKNQGIFTNNISVRSNNGNTKSDYISGNYDKTDYFYNLNGTSGSKGVDPSQFVSTTFVPYTRDASGNIVYGSFLRLKSTSILYTAGANDTYVGAIPSDITGVTLNMTNLSLEVGKTAALTATVLPETAIDKTVAWTSNDNSIATVKDGVVTAVKPGKVTITVQAGGTMAECTVEVTAAPVPAASTTGSLPNTGSPIDSSLAVVFGSILAMLGAVLIFADNKRRMLN